MELSVRQSYKQVVTLVYEQLPNDNTEVSKYFGVKQINKSLQIFCILFSWT